MKISSKSIIVIIAISIILIILGIVFKFPKKEQVIIKNMSIKNITDFNEIYDKDNIEETKDWNIKKVHMEIKEGSITKTKATLLIIDNNDKPAQYSTEEYFFIEKKQNNEWKKLEWRATTPGFTESAIHPLKGTKTFEMQTDWEKHYGRLKKGEYRICKEITKYPQKKQLYAEFIVK